MAEVTMDSILTSISSVVTKAIDWMGDFLTAITGSPVLLLFVVAIPVVGLGIGLLNRLFRTN